MRSKSAVHTVSISTAWNHSDSPPLIDIVRQMLDLFTCSREKVLAQECSVRLAKRGSFDQVADG